MKVWIAKDKNGQVLPYNECPQRDTVLGYWYGNIPHMTDNDLPENLIGRLTWEGEPIEVEIIIKEKDK